MRSITFFLSFIPVIAFLLLVLNLAFAPHNPYQEKSSTFECGFHSFLGQNRTQFSISFFIYALLFLLFDLELLVIYPYVVSSYDNSGYGLVIVLIFFSVLTIGFVFELGKKALNIDSKQYKKNYNKYVNKPIIAITPWSWFIGLLHKTVDCYIKKFSLLMLIINLIIVRCIYYFFITNSCTIFTMLNNKIFLIFLFAIVILAFSVISYIVYSKWNPDYFKLENIISFIITKFITFNKFGNQYINYNLFCINWSIWVNF